MNCVEELEYRGLIKDISDEKLKKLLNEKQITFYIGTDPTADSLHIGHLSSFLICKWLAKYGHKPIILIGGATGLIGDPRPTSERAMITYEQVEHNFEGLKKQINKLFKEVEVVNNYTWCKDLNFIDYLRDYGKYFNINYMLNKDIIRRRLDEGITYTEFSYMIMQALDFLYLYKNKNVIMQVAGQDQWGNITAGIELIRKKEKKEAYAFTLPLVTKKDGTKFGKSEGGAVWLDENKTSPYELYQFFLNSEDEMVIPYLKRYTFLDKEEIEKLAVRHQKNPEAREAARKLAFEVVKFVHGEKKALKAQNTSEILFKNKGITDDMPKVELDSLVINNGISLIDLLLEVKLAPSKSEARRLILQGGIKLNRQKITDVDFMVNKTVVEGDKILLQKGKKVFLQIVVK